MTTEEVKEFMLNEQKVCHSIQFEREGHVCSLVYQQELTLAEVSELINKFDPSTEGKECIELGVDGTTFRIIDLNNWVFKVFERCY